MMYNYRYDIVVTGYSIDGDATELLRFHKDKLSEKEARDQKKQMMEEFTQKIEHAFKWGTFCRLNNLFFYPYKYAAIKVS